MKQLYFILFILFVSCNQKLNTTTSNKSKCDYCKKILTKNIFLVEPKIVDKVMDAIPLIGASPEKDTTKYENIYTSNEIKFITNNMFCFLGKREVEILLLLNEKMDLVFENIDSDFKVKTFYYTSGGFSGNPPLFWIFGGGHLSLNFTKIDGDWLYTGTKKDSVNLKLY